MLATITYTDEHLYRRSRPLCVIHGVGKKVWLSGEHIGKGKGKGTGTGTLSRYKHSGLQLAGAEAKSRYLNSNGGATYGDPHHNRDLGERSTEKAGLPAATPGSSFPLSSTS
jgi:hypothetical protein